MPDTEKQAELYRIREAGSKWWADKKIETIVYGFLTAAGLGVVAIMVNTYFHLHGS